MKYSHLGEISPSLILNVFLRNLKNLYLIKVWVKRPRAGLNFYLQCFNQSSGSLTHGHQPAIHYAQLPALDKKLLGKAAQPAHMCAKPTRASIKRQVFSGNQKLPDGVVLSVRETLNFFPRSLSSLLVIDFQRVFSSSTVLA